MLHLNIHHLHRICNQNQEHSSFQGYIEDTSQPYLGEVVVLHWVNLYGNALAPSSCILFVSSLLYYKAFDIHNNPFHDNVVFSYSSQTHEVNILILCHMTCIQWLLARNRCPLGTGYRTIIQSDHYRCHYGIWYIQKKMLPLPLESSLLELVSLQFRHSHLMAN